MLILFMKSVFILLFGLSFRAQVCHGSHSSIRVDQGYKGVVIALSPDMQQSDDIIDKIQSLIKEASNALHAATDGTLFFEEVSILIPKDWTSIPNPTAIKETSISYSNADIIVAEKGFDQSFAQQYAGCGKHGLPIILAKGLVTGDQQISEMAKLLVHEWAHYRYGVFNEFGFTADPLYPSYYSIAGKPDSNEILINSCTDGHKEFNHRTVMPTTGSTEFHCELSTSNSTGMPTNHNCIPLPDIKNNTFESSLMYSHSVSKVSKFCGSPSGKGSHEHNVNSPNKHNSLCDGKDTWSVIKAHPDFKSKSSAELVETTVNIWRHIGPKVLFAVPSTTNMNSYRPRVNAALSKYLNLDWPGSETALFTFNKGIPIKTVSWTTSGNYQPINFKNENQRINLETVLSSGLEMYQGKIGGLFVVLIGGNELEHDDSKIIEISNKFKEINVKINIIMFPMPNLDQRKEASELIQPVVSITGGQVFYVSDKSVLAAHQINKGFGNYDQKYQTINETIFDIINNKNINFSLTIDKTMIGQELRVYYIQSVSANEDNYVIDEVSIESENIGPIVTQILDNSGYVIGAKFSVVSDHLGLMKMTAKLNTNSKSESTSLIAVAEITSTRFQSTTDTPVTAECRLSTEGEINPNEPLLAYVRINQGYDALISYASVDLVVSYENKVISTIPMLDNGLGDPDITQGDGIYSQYIIIKTIVIGNYAISAVIKDKEGKVVITRKFGSTSLPTTPNIKPCCGSRIAGDNTPLTTTLSRLVSCGSVYSLTPSVTNFPPNSVRDLRIENVDYNNRTVSLLWTSPGGDYTYGSVSKYKIRAFHGSADKHNDPDLRRKIKDTFDSTKEADIEIQSIDKSSKSGEEQRSEIKILSEEEGVYYLALKAYNSDKGSVVSNLVMAYMKSNVKIQSTTAFANDVRTAPVDGSGGAGSSLAGLKWWEILSICLGCAIVLLLVIIISICFVGKRRRKTDEAEATVPTRRAPDPPRVSPDVEKNQSILLDDNSLTRSEEKIPNINSFHNNNAYDTASQHTIQPLNVNALDPIQSWDAKALLSHWGRVQEAKQRHEPPPVMRVEEILDSASSNRSQSYASSEDDNTAIYTNPNNWRYQDVTARPTYIPNGYTEPLYRTHDPMRSNTPSDTVPRIYSTINRKPTQNVSQV